MTRPTLPFGALALSLAVVASPCVAQSAPAQTAPTPPADTIQLTDLQRMQILDGNTMESAAAARGEAPASDRAIHGEVGVMIGSHGTRGAYGVADIPLGDTAHATVAFESDHVGRR